MWLVLFFALCGDPNPDLEPLFDWDIRIEADQPGVAINPALLGHYDLSGALFDYAEVPGLVEVLAQAGFTEWRVGLGRWEAATQMLPSLTDGTQCTFPLPDVFAPAGYDDERLLLERDWFIDDGNPVALADTADPSRYHLAYLYAVLDQAEAFGVEPFVSIDLMPRALASRKDPQREDCIWSFSNRVSNAPPEDPSVFAAAATELVARVSAERSVTYWEIWNEPEAIQFWDPPDLDRFFQMSLITLIELDQFRAQNPSAAELKFGLASFLRAETAAALIATLDQNPLPDGRHVPIDFLSFHAYSNAWTEIISDIALVRAAVDGSANYRHLELVLGEWGPDLEATGGDVTYAYSMEPVLLMSSVIVAGAALGLDHAHHTFFWDYFPQNALTWGLLSHSVEPKPLFRAYELLAQAIAPGSERLELSSTGTQPQLALAARDAFGTLRLLFVNHSGQVLRTRVRVKRASAEIRDVRIFDNAQTGPRAGTFDGGVLNVPPRSLVLLVVE